jgi:uncharacterized membrane protein
MEITDDDKLWALLAYLLTPVVPIILLLMEDKKDRPFIKAHNMQALVFGVVAYIIGSFTCCVPIVGLVLAIMWGIKAYNGELVEIPVITDFCKNQGWA